jgi:CheY-like chemotaxis protein
MEASLKVLIAEDDAIFRYTLERILEPQFRVVARVGDGAAAVQAVEEHEPDIALLDISMPVLDGLEAAQKITEITPTVRVIIGRFRRARLDPQSPYRHDCHSVLRQSSRWCGLELLCLGQGGSVGSDPIRGPGFDPDPAPRRAAKGTSRNLI